MTIVLIPLAGEFLSTCCLIMESFSCLDGPAYLPSVAASRACHTLLLILCSPSVLALRMYVLPLSITRWDRFRSRLCSSFDIPRSFARSVVFYIFMCLLPTICASHPNPIPSPIPIPTPVVAFQSSKSSFTIESSFNRGMSSCLERRIQRPTCMSSRA